MTADGLRDALVSRTFSLLDAPKQGEEEEEEEAKTDDGPARPR
jgi:hypothetical protein